jgi:putative sugar O-methyltransferase
MTVPEARGLSGAMTPEGPAQVADNPALLEALAEDAERAGREWVAAEYWQSYCTRILRELRSVGLRDFRRNAYVVKGYAATGPLKAGMPRAAWKRRLWRLLEAAPVFSVIVAEYRRLLRVEAEDRRRLAIRLARFALDAVAARFPGIKPPRGIANGNAWDAFEWRGHLVSADWALYVTRAADFYASVPPDKVTSLIEIGPGLGLATLAHLSLNPHLRVAVHVDIVPVVYVSTQFLGSSPDLCVVDYLATRKEARIRPEASERPTVYQIAPWQLPSLDGPLDYFFNAFSFQEMSKEICANYAAHLCRVAAGGGLIHAARLGADLASIGPRVPDTLAFLESLFAPTFPQIAKVGGLWPAYFEGDPEETRLFRR